MTTTRFLPHLGSPIVRCMGANHRDEGTRGRCGSCGVEVVRLTDPSAKGRLIEMRVRHTASDMLKIDYRCWHEAHECSPDRVVLYQAARDEELAAGALIIGQDVTVVHGRKIAKGTEGVIRWIGPSEYGLRVGLAIDGHDRLVYTAEKNVTASRNIAPPTEPAAPAATASAARKGTHTDCTHEATKAARAACRRAR